MSRKKSSTEKEKVMVVLKSTTEGITKDSVFLGLKIPKETASFLSLFCIAKGITKTSIIKSLLNQWHEEQQERETTKRGLIDEIVERSLKIWDTYPKRNCTFQGYLQILRTELTFKAVDKKYVDIILQKLQDEKNKR